MGMDRHVEAIGKPDERFRQMWDAYQACAKAGIAPPDEVSEYFNWDTPHPDGIKISLRVGEAVTEIREDYKEGFEVALADLPATITHIRFFNSY